MVLQSNYKKVVFIDDDKELVSIYNSILKRKNLSEFLICFDNAKDGINYLKETNKDELPDYILLDLYMPDMDGFEFLRNFEKMKKVNNGIEIYVCTSSKKKDDRKQVMKYSFVNAYLEKPLSSDFLEFLIKDTA